MLMLSQLSSWCKRNLKILNDRDGSRSNLTNAQILLHLLTNIPLDYHWYYQIAIATMQQSSGRHLAGGHKSRTSYERYHDESFQLPKPPVAMLNKKTEKI